jgi:hypothetical protein
MYKRFSVLVTHSQKRAQRLVLSRLSKIAVIIKTFFYCVPEKEIPKIDFSFTFVFLIFLKLKNKIKKTKVNHNLFVTSTIPDSENPLM